jgi:hypothetical protein
MIVAQRLASLIEARDPDIVMTGAGSGGSGPGRGALGAHRLGCACQRDRGTWDRRWSGGDAQCLRRQAHHRKRPDRWQGHHHGPPEQRDRRTGVLSGDCRDGYRGRGAAAASRADHERLEAETKAAQIDDARIIVAGGRGVGGSDGFGLIQELADALGGAVGATRAAVDSGWIPYSQQIGQTGKIVKPQLYLAMGISGAIQHKVGMQTASTIIAVNRDPDAPIADFADMIVIGDLVEVGNALLAELRARSG